MGAVTDYLKKKQDDQDFQETGSVVQNEIRRMKNPQSENDFSKPIAPISRNANLQKKGSFFDGIGKTIENTWIGTVNGLKSIQDQFNRQTTNTLSDRSKMNEELTKKLIEKDVEKGKISNEDSKKYLENQQNQIFSSSNLQKEESERSKRILEEKNKNTEKAISNSESIDNPIMKKASELAPSVGQMLPGFIPGVGTTYLFGSGSGNYYDEAKQRGMSEEESNRYSGIMGVAEGATQMIGVGKLLKGTKAIGKAGIRKGIKDLAIGATDNFIQEALMEPTGELTTKLVAGDKYLKNDYQTVEGWKNLGKDMLVSGIDGFLVGGIMAGVGAGVGTANNVYNKVQNKQKVSKVEVNQALNDTKKAGIDVDKIINQEMSNTQNNNQSGLIKSQQNNPIAPIPIEKIPQIVEQKTKNNLSNRNDVSMMPIDKILQYKDDGGYRTKENINNLTEDIKQHGIESPIEIIRNEDGTIAINNGNHRLEVANKLGLKEVPVIYNDYSNIDNTNNLLYNNKNEEFSNYVKGGNEYDNRNNENNKIINERNRIDNGNTTDISITPRYGEQASTNDRLLNKIQEYNDRSSSNTTFKKNQRGLEESSSFNLLENENIDAPITKEAREQLISKQEINNQELKAPISKEIEQYLIKENKNKKNTEELPDTKIFIEDKKIKERATLKEIKDTFAQRFVNKGHYIDKLAKETGNKKLIWKYDRTMNTFNEAQISIGKSQINSKGEIVGKSLIDIFKPSQEIGLNKEFEDYLLNKHNIARTALSKSIYGDNVTAPQSKKIIESYEEKYPQFKEWSKEVNNYNDNNLRDLVDNGMVSESTYKNLRDIYGDYVPTYRDITETMADFEENKVGSNPLKYATESDKAILSVKEGMAEQTLSIKKAIRINDLGVELYETLGKNKIMDSIPIDHMSMQIIGGDVIQKAGKGNNTFAIFQDGEITYFKISDEIYSAFSKDTIQNKINNSKVTKTLLSPVEKLSKVQRNMLTTYSIGFAFNNPIKDFQDALFNTKYSTISFLKNYSKALYNIGINGDWYQKYQNNGGAANTYFDYEKGLLPIGNKNPIKKFANKIKDFNEVLEQAPRLAEYISTIENGGTIDEALYNAADLTTNFKRGGDVAKAANKYGANFFNASIQGLDKFYRNISGQRGWKGYANIITKATLFQIAPAIINGLLLSDDDDYEDLPEYTKDNYFLFKLGNGKFFRIPKGRVSSVIGGLARRVLETGQGKKVDWKSLKDTTINQLAPNNPLTDNLIAPVYQATKNEAWYGGEIVNKRLQKLPQGEQYDESTDLISKFIGEKTNISPKKINYVLDQYSGGVGDVILPMLTPQAENNILEDKFTTDSVIKNKHVSEYYDKLDELEKNKNSSKATDNDILKYKYMASESDKLSELYNEKRKIQNSGIKDSDKKQKVRQIQEQINKIVIKKLNNKDNIKIKDGIGEVDGIYFRLNKNNEWEKMSNSENNNEVKKYKEALSLGLTNKSYQTFKNKISPIEGKKDITGKSIEGSTNGKKALEIMNTNYSTTEKNAMLKLMSPTAKNPETTSTLSGITKTEKAYTDYFALNKSDTFFQVKLSRDDVQDIQDLNISQDEFMRFAQEIGNVKGQKDKNGKTISGSKKKAVANYIDGLNLSSGEKAILFAKAGYPEKKYKQAIYSYINGLKLSATRKKEIWDGLGYK